ncbi:hypothetical protein GDO81_023853 [Engystomops pustulosus]|uniref:Secreted protein n=1 Tax=Engystomops pustulosus TaxID=76066 RepID=A0AAV6Z3Z8_ENGPU|nr:hypothetical protein GDO81_023853 [Engystomops pustulosus]
MSLFSSSTFCCSFFLLCSGGRLLKSSGVAPCFRESFMGDQMKKRRGKRRRDESRSARGAADTSHTPCAKAPKPRAPPAGASLLRVIVFIYCQVQCEER